MKEKKTEVITFRTTETIKRKLGAEAEAKGWTISQLTEKIIAQYATNTPAQNTDHINIVNINQI